MEYKGIIQKYLQNRLTPKEELEFNELFKNDMNFKKEVEFQTNLKKVVVHEDANNFKNLIKELEHNVNKPKSKPSYTKWLAAASLVLLFGLAYFMTSEKQMTSNTLFASYFEPYRNVVHPLVRGEEQQTEKSIAFLAYEKGDYQKAVTLFTNLYTTTKEPYYLFYKANALLKLERANEAVPLLLEHLKTKDTLTQKTNWYLALAYLKIKEKQKAKELLKKVIANKSYNNLEAKKLLRKID